ncbi:MAG: DUF1207 domain-containing protein [Nitrospira sp.]|uniref:DUF1207 domain-containing protein n=1 Tax=Nitrospira defluvii TaxID=330214 RepID=A0ABN7L2P8_9BACT|nr:DUF1207 domain-containing protein [Nitrospira defluvii]MCS6328520.1 DUF1207 domain-containing protein [Nitrospira sp.]CAE6727761.1 conserved hypothetical protein [Nitrospira defluvii]
MHQRCAVALWVMIGVLSGIWGGPAYAGQDEYIAGYAASMLEHEFHLSAAVIEVEGGMVDVYVPRLGAEDPEKILSSLRAIPGVTGAHVHTGQEAAKSAKAGAVRAVTPESHSKFLPRGLLVEPLHADPRWPHFGAAYHALSSGREFASAFGESFAVYRNAAPFKGEWELGIQAGVFGVFDTERRSIDLINADYTIGVVASYRADRLSGFVRIRHQSSHLGDEFILNNPQVMRVNLSYEEIDLKLSYDLTSWMRWYGGVGTLVRKDPRTLGRETTQAGVELKSPWLLAGGTIRPVAYADFQANARANWAVSRSIMAGLQFENARIGDRKLQVLGEYFSGPSPDGQLFSKRVEWVGLGVHLWF